jgi:hypothetical protein
MRNTIIGLLWLVLLAAPTLFAIDNLKLNPHLDYGSDSLDGPLITGTDAQSGFVSGKTNYVIRSRSTTRGTSLMSSYWMYMAPRFMTNPVKWTPE